MNYQGFIRNLSRSPNYGLRSRRRGTARGPQEPVGPRLIRGRGILRRRRRGVSTAALAFYFAAIAAIGLIAIQLVRLVA